jgi:hypothetical protein
MGGGKGELQGADSARRVVPRESACSTVSLSRCWLQLPPPRACCCSHLRHTRMALSSHHIPHLHWLRAQVGAAPACGQFLSASWSVCAIPIGSGAGTVRVNIPTPSAVTGFAVTPSRIAAEANPAAAQPIALPVSGATAVNVTFSDGSVRDFSADDRTTVRVVVGNAICQVARGERSAAHPLCCMLQP